MPLVDTNTTFQNNPNNAAINAPDNMSDFMTQAKNFVAKAQASGADNTAIANTIRFMYGLTQQNITNKQAQTNTPLQQVQGDVGQQAENRLGKGTIGYNQDTGDYYNTLPGGSANVGSSKPKGMTSADTYFDTPSLTTPATTPAAPKSTFDPAAFDQGWNSVSPTPNKSTEQGPVVATPYVPTSSQAPTSSLYQSPLLSGLQNMFSGKLAKYGG